MDIPEKKPKLTFNKCEFEGNETGILHRGKVDIESTDTAFRNNKNAVITSEKNSYKYCDRDRWYKKPVWILAISVTSGVIVSAFKVILNVLFP